MGYAEYWRRKKISNGKSVYGLTSHRKLDSARETWHTKDLESNQIHLPDGHLRKTDPRTGPIRLRARIAGREPRDTSILTAIHSINRLPFASIVVHVCFGESP